MPISSLLPVFDGHNDTLVQIYMSPRAAGRSFFDEADASKGHIDLPRARKGGMGGGFFAIWTPPEGPQQPTSRSTFGAPAGGYAMPLAQPVDPAYAQRFVITLMARLFQWEAESEGQLRVIRSHTELTRCLADGTFAAILHLEGADAIDQDLDALHVFYQAGLRSLGPTWSRPTVFGHGVQFRYPHTPDIGPGLTEAGLRLVKACNNLGVMLDLAHLNEKGFWDVERLSTAPLVVTHTGAHALCPSSRNLTDKQIDAVGTSNGVIGVNFFVGDIRPDGQANPDTPLAELIRHVDYIVDRIGIDHVAFGSDFDGAMIPQAIGDVTGYPHLINALRKHGYDDDALGRITHQNWIRVLADTWK